MPSHPGMANSGPARAIRRPIIFWRMGAAGHNLWRAVRWPLLVLAIAGVGIGGGDCLIQCAGQAEGRCHWDPVTDLTILGRGLL